MAANLIIRYSFQGRGTPSKITIPTTSFHLAKAIIPIQLKEFLNKENIDLEQLVTSPDRKDIKGILITIEDQGVMVEIAVE